MQLNYRQGIVAAQTDSGVPKYLKASTTTGYVSLNVNPTPTILTVAHGGSNYLLKFDTSVDLAWQISGPATAYLYVDIDQLTANTTFGVTTVMPIVQLTAPTSPADGQHWFDLTNTLMQVWSAARQKWQVKIRIIVGSVLNGNVNTIQMFGPGASTISLTTPGVAGFILLDTLLNPLKKSSLNGEFLTGADDAREMSTVGTSGVLVQPVARVVPVRAAESIPKMSMVWFYANDTVKLASSDPGLNPPQHPIGMVLDDLVNGDVGTFVLSGEIVYDQWNWEGHAGEPLYVDSNGQVTLTRPNGLMAFRIGYVKNANSILLNVDAETNPQVYTSSVNSLIIAGHTPVVATDVINGIGERVVTISVPTATESNDGLVTAVQVTTYDGYAAEITANTAAIATLQTSKANTVHTHVINDVTGLQGDLDTLTAAVSTKLNIPSPASSGNFPMFASGGQLADSGYSPTSFAPFVHTHVINDVSGLQTALDQKAYRAHLNAVSEIYQFVDRSGPFDVGSGSTLQALLNAKIDVGTNFPISQIVNLQTTLNSKINIGDPIPISEVTGLQTALDSKAFVTHTHAISDVTGLQAALDGKEPTIDPGTTSQYWRGDKTWQTLPSAGATALSGLSDVALGYPSPNEFLMFNGGQWVDNHVLLNSNVFDVNVSSPVSGQFLKWNGTKWVNANAPTGGASALSGLSDVAIGYLTYKDVLFYDGATWRNHQLLIDELSNVSISGAGTGQVLYYDGTNWVNNTLSLGSSLTDVVLTYPVPNQVLAFNGGTWVNQDNDLATLHDVSLTSVTDGQFLAYSNAASKWVNVAPPTGSTPTLVTTVVDLGV